MTWLFCNWGGGGKGGAGGIVGGSGGTVGGSAGIIGGSGGGTLLCSFFYLFDDSIFSEFDFLFPVPCFIFLCRCRLSLPECVTKLHILHESGGCWLLICWFKENSSSTSKYSSDPGSTSVFVFRFSV